jgi:hypothetical protein
MKTPKISPALHSLTHLTACFICAFLCCSSCEKSNLDYIATPVDQTVPSLEPYLRTTPEFSLVIQRCVAGGAAVTVNIDNPHKYSFLWEINGHPGGHGVRTASGICGGIAKVTVTRLADGESMSKSVTLPTCIPANNQEMPLQNNTRSSAADPNTRLGLKSS